MGSKFLTPEQLQILREYFQIPKLEVELRPTWGSQSTGHREELHGDLKRKMAKGYPFSDASISHCHTLGGFVFVTFDSDHVIALGFDVEEDDRVHQDVVLRICKNPSEVTEAPSYASLWTAKEAAYKALKGPQQPKVVAGVELTDWQKVDSQIETVRLKDPQKFNYSSVKGLVFKKAPYTLAFFISSP